MTLDVIHKRIMERLSDYPDALWGIADISDSPYAARYPRALVLAVPHRERITLRNYTEEGFEQVIRDARERMEELVSGLCGFLEENHIPYFVPPAAQTDEISLEAPFSFKFAAINAGMGWIGKNDVLITREYGPRVRLGAVLVDCDLPTGKPIARSLCGDTCDLCVNACPYGAIKGVQWDRDKRRGELIDYQLCNAKRSLYLKNHGRKNACGLCMAACPVGTQAEGDFDLGMNCLRRFAPMIYIALLRGINVGGKNMIKMADLKRMCEPLGLTQVKTYIQSGNVLFASGEGEEALRQKIEDEIGRVFGFPVGVVLRTAEELERLIGNCPFTESEISAAEAAAPDVECLYVALLDREPLPEKVEAIKPYQSEKDQCLIIGRDAYLLFHHSIRDSKLAMNLHRLEVTQTTRNWKTMRKLAEMASEMEK